MSGRRLVLLLLGLLLLQCREHAARHSAGAGRYEAALLRRRRMRSGAGLCSNRSSGRSPESCSPVKRDHASTESPALTVPCFEDARVDARTLRLVEALDPHPVAHDFGEGCCRVCAATVASSSTSPISEPVADHDFLALEPGNGEIFTEQAGFASSACQVRPPRNRNRAGHRYRPPDRCPPWKRRIVRRSYRHFRCPAAPMRDG